MSDIHFNPQSPLFERPDASFVISYPDALNFLNNRMKDSLLRNVVQLLQQIREQKIQKGVTVTPNQTALQTALSKLSLPTGASLLEAKNSALFTALQPAVKTELHSLLNLLTLLKTANPHLANTLNPKWVQLQQILKNFPNVSQKDLSFVKSTLDQCNTHFVNQLPSSIKTQFLKMEAQMYLKMAKESEEAFLALKEMSVKLGNQANSFKKLQELLQQIRTLLPEGGKAIDPAKIPQILAALASLMEEYKNIPALKRAEIEKALSALLKMKSANNTSFSSLLSSSLMSQWMKELLEEDPSISREQLKRAVQQRLDETDMPSEMEESMQALLEEKNFPEISGMQGIVLAQVKGDTLTINPEVIPELAQQFSLKTPTVERVSIALLKGEESTQINGDEVGSLAHGCKLGVEALAVTSQPQEVGISAPPASTAKNAATSSTAVAAPSAQDAFANAVFNTIIPTEMNQLEKYDMLLFFCNYAANFGNNLMNNITDFSSAASNYDFGGFLNQTGTDSQGYPIFSGSPEQAEAKLTHEMNAVQTDQAELTQLLSQLKGELALLQMNPPPAGSPEAIMKQSLSASTYNQLITAINQQIPDVKAALAQVKALSTFMGIPACTVHSLNTTPPTFQVQGFGGGTEKNWLPTLTSDEDAVVNGVTISGTPPTQSGGLGRISSSIGAFVTQFSDQGSEQQEELQLVMAEFQQLMSIVSSALQTWNQCYNAPAQAIGQA